MTCYPDWAETAKAVAHIVFERDGSSYVCSGTLVNTRSGRGTPYFLTAQHCIADDTTARSVSAFWSYQTSTCNGTPPNRRDVPRTLGARYLVGTPTSSGDGTLIQLNGIPSGVRFSGWDPNPPASGTQVVGIHHPNGDFKRISFGISSAAHPYSGRDLAKFIGANWSGGGLTEGGSSGSGLFSGSLQLVGMLSHGPKADSAAQYCSMLPFTDNYGSFAAFYPVIRDYLEERTVAGTTPPATATPAGGALTPGQTRSLKLGPVTGNRLFNGQSGFTVTVPQGATRLEVTLRTATPNADLDLFVRFGQDVVIENGKAVADFKSESSGGDEQVVVSGSQLRAGTYYIALGLFTPGVEVQTSLTANVTTTAQPPVPTNALVSGQARDFTLEPVNIGTLYYGAYGFTIAVPPGATRLEITLRTSTANTNVDLYARFGQDVALSGSSAVADFKSEGTTGDEQIVITGSNLRTGTYYIAFGLLTTGRQAQCTITATVTTPSQPPTPGGNALISGQARNFSLGPVTVGTLYNGANGFTIAVPQGATRLEINLRTQATNVDVDLYARFGQDVVIENSRAVADFRSENADANEQIVIAGASLRPGAYYIALGVFTTGTSIQSTLTATITTTSAPPPSGAQTLTSGTPASFRLGPVANATAFFGGNGYRIQVPQGATRLDVRLATASPAEADLDLYIRYDRDIEIADRKVVADYLSEGPTGTERITATPQSSPALRPGTYYIALGLFSTNVEAVGTITATVVVGSGTAPQSSTQLTPGVPAKFSLPAVRSPTLYSGNYSFRINVPDGASKVTVQLRSDIPTADTDLFVRRDTDNDLDGEGNVVTDYASTSPYADETVVFDAASEPPLRPGTYYVSVALYTQGVPISGTILATLERTPVQTPGAQADLRPEVPAPFSLPAVGGPTLFTGDDAFRLDVPADTTRVDFILTTEPSTTDVDLFVRYGAPPAVNSSQGVTADHSSTSDTGNEQITIDGSSRPVLRAGTYYVALGLYSLNTPAAGALTAVLYRGGKTAPLERRCRRPAAQA